MAKRTVRLPLQSGATALTELLFAQIGVVFIVVGLATVTRVGFTAVHALMGAIVLALLLVGARRRRASDVVIDTDGLAIESGPKHGIRLSFDRIASCRIEEDTGESVSVNGQKTYLHRLVVVHKGGTEQALAESLDREEQRSMAALASAIRARVGGPEPAASASGVSTDIVVCATCGAPVPPAPAPSVPCGYCGALVPMPPALRDRLLQSEESGAARRRLERGVARLLDQPGARATNRLVLSFGIAWLLAGPLIALGAYSLSSIHGALPVLTVLLVFWSIARTAVGERIALRALLVGFGARARAGEASPYACRLCGAPLPAAPETTVLVGCAYCEADNVLGLDLLPVARELVADELDVEHAFSARKRARIARDVKLLLAAALFAFAIWRFASG